MGVATRTKLSEGEYLTAERAAEEKSEYLAGEVFAMAGASRAHSLIVGNLVRTLGNRLEDRPCEVYPADMRVQVRDSGLYAYPDVVVCGPPRFLDEREDTLLNPTVIIEVLSPTTEAYDRGAKFAHYRRLPSLREYVLLSQTHAYLERFERVEDGPKWTFSEVSGLEGTLRLSSVDAALPLSELYARVEVSTDPQSPTRP
jgi:Uma2 family endonuclease